MCVCVCVCVLFSLSLFPLKYNLISHIWYDVYIYIYTFTSLAATLEGREDDIIHNHLSRRLERVALEDFKRSLEESIHETIATTKQEGRLLTPDEVCVLCKYKYICIDIYIYIFVAVGYVKRICGNACSYACFYVYKSLSLSSSHTCSTLRMISCTKTLESESSN
jgi:hypothetical protein